MADPNETKNAAPPYEITMEEFLGRLESVRTRLFLHKNAYVPKNGADEHDDIQKDDIEKLLLFFSLNEVAKQWGEQQHEQLGEAVFGVLSEFLDGVTYSSDRPLKIRWQNTHLKNFDWPGYPEKPVEQCIAIVQDDCDKKELADHYGITDFPGENNDKSIVSIQALILLWFTALPYTEEATETRSNYCDKLKSRLGLLLDPSVLGFVSLEYGQVSGEAIAEADDSIVFSRIVEKNTEKCIQEHKESEKSHEKQENEDVLHMGMSRGR